MTTKASARARWKGVETRVARKLNEILSDVGNFSLIERIPILGRTGPDLTINETGLVIDVKSRAIISAQMFPAKYEAIQSGDLVSLRLNQMDRGVYLWSKTKKNENKQVTSWYEHMDEWTQKNSPDGISCIILHWPGMPIGNAAMVIHQKDLRRLYDKLNYSN